MHPPDRGKMQNIKLSENWQKEAEMFIRAPECIAELEGRANIDQHGEKFVRNVTNIHIPKEGGMFMEYEGVPHLEVGFPLWDTVSALDQAKKLASGSLGAFIRVLSKSKIKAVFLVVFFRKELKAVIYEMLDSAYRQLKNYRVYDKRYCRMVQEIRRVINCVNPKDKESVIIRDRIHILISLFLEFDSAYRYRAQYVLGRLDKEAFARKSIKEILRLCQLGYDREGSGRVKKAWKAFWWICRIISFVPRYREVLIALFSELNPKEVEFTEADKYFAIEKTEKSFFKEFDFRDL